MGQPVGGQPPGAPVWTGNVCTTPCSSGASCVPGWSCGALTGQAGDVCTCSYSPEACDGLDDDCDGVVDDEPATDEWCGSGDVPGTTCQNGACVCGSGGTLCGTGDGQFCTDTQTDSTDCGGCGVNCPYVGTDYAVCQAGACCYPDGALVVTDNPADYAPCCSGICTPAGGGGPECYCTRDGG